MVPRHADVTPGTIVRPFLWTPELGLRRLPTLAGGFSHDALDLNEFGAIPGYSTTSEGDVHATLRTPTVGPLLVGVEAVEEGSTTAQGSLWLWRYARFGTTRQLDHGSGASPSAHVCRYEVAT